MWSICILSKHESYQPIIMYGWEKKNIYTAGKVCLSCILHIVQDTWRLTLKKRKYIGCEDQQMFNSDIMNFSLWGELFKIKL